MTADGRLMDGHYFFPPASAYRLNRCLYRLRSDAGFRARYLADPAAAIAEAGLDAATGEAVRALERDRLVALGAHPYLVFMAGLRLRMERDPGAFERFQRIPVREWGRMTPRGGLLPDARRSPPASPHG
jgi:hypothetical protein